MKPPTTPRPKTSDPDIIRKAAEKLAPKVADWIGDVIRIVSEHPEYPEPCPMLHEVAAKAAAEMNKEWVMHMVRETCRQTKAAILADLKQSLPNVKVHTSATSQRTPKHGKGGDK